ncbi:MAG TPA: DUF3307 domain-containing protein [Candidatus Limnocylindrales bacterium]|nr:DUF3307 domain-containing protein [Candidatus Limnocylindrales bacterium]
MTDHVLVLGWLVLAHLLADFVLQTGSIARAKAESGSAALGGLLAHGLIVAALLVPVGLAFGGSGWAFVAWSAILHVAIDRAKVVLTRRAARRALAEARAAHEGPAPEDHLGRAWTPAPATLFVLDQVAHLAVLAVGWAVFLGFASVAPGFADAVDSFLGPTYDRAAAHDVISAGVVFASLVIINVRAASIFVAVLVRPVEEGLDGSQRWGARAAPAVAAEAAVATAAAASTPQRWSVRLGPVEAVVAAQPDRPADRAQAAPLPGPVGLTARVGATIGVLERLLIVVFVLTGTDAAIGFVVAAKTLARFRQLDDREFAEYYLLGTLASVAVAIVTALAGRAALSALLA